MVSSAISLQSTVNKNPIVCFTINFSTRKAFSILLLNQNHLFEKINMNIIQKKKIVPKQEVKIHLPVFCGSFSTVCFGIRLLLDGIINKLLYDTSFKVAF